MADMLVKLYDLPIYQEKEINGIKIKRAIAPEKIPVCDWVRQNFSKAWAGECEAAFSRVPSSCFIAVKNGKIEGFACYDATAKGFFGPIGVSVSERKSGIGKALLLAALNQMRSDGYAYAIIGWAGPTDFFKKNCGAKTIEDSEPGIYSDLVK
ncbi:MAG: GNAT family N-acetyltransferase [Elusimicrobia bacterium]|nr:GNAT family N-acetyltransferase [Elusimicrobiota bacterium]